jgi:transcriptional regulator with XRE-family HTH domain
MPTIGVRIRQLREQKKLSQGDIEEKTGLLRCYISRVENGHTVPSLETLERFAGALEVPFYRFFYTDDDPPPTPYLSPRKSLVELAAQDGATEPEANFLLKFSRLLSRLADSDREVILALAKKMAVDI